jgi:hypothetical protein
MSAPTPNSQAPTTDKQVEQKQNDKEYNFRMLEAKYEKQLQQERAARLEAERIAQEKSKKPVDDDDDDEPYIDKKKLNKKLDQFGQQQNQQTQSQINQAVSQALKEERKQAWLKNNADFYDVLQHAEKFAQADPELAETILEMPEGFERQKLVYKNIKALGLHKPQVKEPSIQEKIDNNRRSPYYQPSGIGTAPYQSAGDFSAQGQKQAFNKMQELKNRLRLN